MSIEDDLKTITILQADFKNKHGVFFEMNWSPPNGGQKIPIPKDTDILELTELKRFKGNGPAYPTVDVPDIPFIPTDKSYRFLIGRGIQLGFDKDGKADRVEKDYWFCKAIHVDADGIYTEKMIEGGDLSLSNFKGN